MLRAVPRVVSLMTPFLPYSFSYCVVSVAAWVRRFSSKGIVARHGLSTSKIPKGQLQEGRQTEQRGLVWNFFKRIINITDYRNAKDNVNPAKNRTFGGITDHSIPFPWEFAAYIFQPWTPGFWIVWVQKNKGCILFAVPGSVHQKQFSRQGFHLTYFEVL